MSEGRATWAAPVTVAKCSPIAHVRAVATLPASEWPPETAAWLRESCAAYLEGARTMDECMQLAVGPSERSLLTRTALEERDRWLVDAAKELSDKLYTAAKDLRGEVLHFEEVYWPKWCALEMAPADATRLRACLFGAFKAAPEREGMPQVPHGVAQLFNILRAGEQGLYRAR